jgi:site-specific recombinase XerD
MSKFSELREQFLLAEARRGLSRRSVELYRGDLARFETWFAQTNGESPDPISVLRSDIRGWQEEMQDTFRPATINRRLTALRQFYRWAERHGLISRDPAGQVRGVPLADPGEEPCAARLPQAVLERILQDVRRQGDARDRAMLEVLFDTGLRPREVCALTVSDYRREAGNAWLQVKTGTRARQIQLAVRVRVALDEYLETRVGAPGSSPLFLSRRKKSITPFVLWHRLKQYASQSGVREINPQAIRRSAIHSFLKRSNVDLLTASMRFGQTDLNRLAKTLAPADKMKTGKGEA